MNTTGLWVAIVALMVLLMNLVYDSCGQSPKISEKQEKQIEAFRKCQGEPRYKDIFEQCVRNGGNHCQDDTITIVCPWMGVG